MEPTAPPATRHLRWAMAAVVVVLLVAGLAPELSESATGNGARIPDEPPGIEFAGHGIAFTEPFVTADDVRAIARGGFTAEFVLELAATPPEGFSPVAQVSNGSEVEQWFLGQWKSRIVVMNGDDYSYERRLPRVTYDAAGHEGEPFLLTVSSGRGGTVLYVDGEPVGQHSGFVQALPGEARLVVGNTLYGTSPWAGVVRGLSFYRESLPASRVRERFEQWSNTGALSPAESPEPWLSYPLDERSGARANDGSGRGVDLVFPPDAVYAERQTLAHNTGIKLAGQLTTRDAALNFLGFIPFGWLLAQLLVQARRTRAAGAVLLAASTGFALSLGIEFAQSWMVSRSSSLLDLVLNSAGALTGAVGSVVLAAPWARVRRRLMAE